jgi:hypothetical protein
MQEVEGSIPFASTVVRTTTWTLVNRQIDGPDVRVRDAGRANVELRADDAVCSHGAELGVFDVMITRRASTAESIGPSLPA